MDKPSLLLLTDDSERLRRWADLLAPAARTLYSSLAEIPAEAAVDIIVTDGPVPPGETTGAGFKSRRGDTGVIALGPCDGADVSLPEDYTARELRLAIELLAEIVRLRRAHGEAARDRQTLQRLASIDPLTGLPNRRGWEEELASRIETLPRSSTLCAAFFDIDHFKNINDEYGHAAGDHALQAVARGLTTGVRPGDYVARLGGDEFGLLISNLLDEAGAVVERVRRHLVQPASETLPRVVTISAGFALATASLPDHSSTAAELLGAADEALRCAKRRGRNQTAGGLLPT